MLFDGQDAKKHCPEANTHIQVKAWVEAANSHLVSCRLERGERLPIEQQKREAIAHANNAYKTYIPANRGLH